MSACVQRRRQIWRERGDWRPLHRIIGRGTRRRCSAQPLCYSTLHSARRPGPASLFPLSVLPACTSGPWPHGWVVGRENSTVPLRMIDSLCLQLDGSVRGDL